VQKEYLNPGLVGVRPKLFIEGKAHPDFWIEEKESFVSCLGIESPGLTSALAIADEISRLLGEL
jgi:L-2-hydroxyglutarate oxidase LhgO